MTAQEILTGIWQEHIRKSPLSRRMLSIMDNAVTGDAPVTDMDIAELAERDPDNFQAVIAVHHFQKYHLVYRPDPEREKFLCRDRALTGTFPEDTPISILSPLEGKCLLIETTRVSERMLGKTDWAAGRDGRPAVRGFLILLTNYLGPERDSVPQQPIHFYFICEGEDGPFVKCCCSKTIGSGTIGQLAENTVKASRNEDGGLGTLMSVKDVKAVLPWTLSYLHELLSDSEWLKERELQ